MAAKRPTSIKVGSVSLPFWQHTKGWRFAWKDKQGKWRYVTRRDKAEAMEQARLKARELSNGAADLSKVSTDTAALLQRVISLGITHGDLDKWQLEQQRPALSMSAAINEFLTLKKQNRGRSLRNVRSLSGDLGALEKHCGQMSLRTVSVSHLEQWLATQNGISPRRRKNLRGSAVTFFRWARRRNYVADGTTAAEKLEVPQIGRKIPQTWTPAEMQLILAHCPLEHLAWPVLAGFAGIRHEELYADPHSDKSPLDWSDFQWDRDILIVRPETAKTGDRRIVPILPVVRKWLRPLQKETGRVVPVRQPFKARKGAPSITAVIGEHVGGWRVNALRHSFISYRAAIVGLAQTAMEAGNSESEARRSYNDAKSKQEAQEWFNLMPKAGFR